MNRLPSQVLPYLLLALLPPLALAGCGGSKEAAGAKAAPAAPAPMSEASSKAAASAPLPGDVSDLAVGNAAPSATGAAKDAAAPGEPGSASAASSPSGAPKSGEATAQIDGSTVAATGEFVSPVRSEVAAKFQGRVGRVMVDEGQRVRRGQPILELETEYLVLDLKKGEADLARAQAAARDAERDFARKKDLIAKGSVAQAAYDRSQAASETAAASVASAESARDLAKQRLSDAVIRSPVDGVVAERRADVGEKLGDNSITFVIMQTSPLKLRFRLPERYLSAARPGQRVRATVDPYPDRTFEGRVALVGGVVDPATRTVMVETEFANRDGRLSPGLFARVQIDLGKPLASQPGGGAPKGAAR